MSNGGKEGLGRKFSDGLSCFKLLEHDFIHKRGVSLVKLRVLFVCLGNICRSPMAEAVFRHLVREKGLTEYFEIDSAGLGGWHVGEPPHEGTRKILEEKQIDGTGLVARQIREEDLNAFDYILVMDRVNLNEIKALADQSGEHRADIRLLMDFAPEKGSSEVPDPYYNGRFSEVYELVEAGCQGFLNKLLREHCFPFTRS